MLSDIYLLLVEQQASEERTTPAEVGWPFVLFYTGQSCFELI